MHRFARTSLPTLAALLVLAGVLPSGAAAATSQRDAQRQAIAALKVSGGSAPVIVFRQPKPVPSNTAIQQAGVWTARQAQTAISRVRALRRAGVSTVAAPVVLRTGSEPAWLFYEDRAPYQAYQHPGRVVLVGVDSGRVTVSKTMLWPPLIGGRLPAFLKGYEAYRAPRYRAFVRSWRLRGTAATDRAGVGPGGLLAGTTPDYAQALGAAADERVQSPAAVAASRQAADRLAAEGSCAIRISDTLGDFYDAGPVDKTRAELGVVFERLARQNVGFQTWRYRYLEGITPGDFVRLAITRHKCKDVLIYVGGGGYRSGDPAVNVGTRGRPDGRIDQQTVTADELRAIMRAHRKVTFKLMIDAPYAGAFLPVLRATPNLLLLATSSGAREGSFTALSDVLDTKGKSVENAFNDRGHLEFTNRTLEGLRCFLSRPDEVANAARAVAEGRSRSFLAWMLGRSFSLCAAGNLADLVAGAPHPVIYQRDGTPPSPGSTPPVTPGPPAKVNHAPVATGDAVTTPEDTAVSLTLAGTDPDGDPLVYTIANGPTKGTLTGSGSTRTYTPNPDANGADSFTFTVSDGHLTSAPATVSLTIDPVNDAPVLALGSATTTFVEAGPAVAVAPDLTVTDVDDTTLEEASVRLANGFAAGEDELVFVDQNGIGGTFDPLTGVLELTGTATVAEYRTALRSVEYRNTSANPSADPRDVVFDVGDGDLTSATVTRVVSITTVNDAPVLAGGGNIAGFVEDDTTGVLVDPSVTVSDVDNANLASATASITGNLAAGEDRLVFVDQNGITGNYDTATGVLTLTGSATKAAYQTALRSIRYRNVNTGDPATATRTVSLQVNDGSTANAASNVLLDGVTVSAVNDAPTVTAGGGTAAFTEGGSAVAVDPALTTADVDDVNLESATVSISSGLATGEDVLALPATPGLSATYTPATGTLAITGTATKAVYQAALRSVTYENANGDDPSGATRTVSFTVNDGALDSTAATTGVTVTPVNDAPVLGGGGNTVTFDEDDTTGVIVNSGVTVSDVDNASMVSATVQLTTGFDATEDELVFVDQNGISGAYDDATGILTLTGTATKAQYQTALRSIRYRNTNTGNPSTVQREVQFRIDDGAATSNVSTAIVSNVGINPSNDAPTVTAGGGSPTFTEGGTAVTVDPALLVADVDSATLTGATVTIGTGFASAEDRLNFTNQNGITGSYASGTGVLTLSGSATTAAYQAALRSVTYGNLNGDDPSATTRRIGFAVTDGALSSTTANTDVTVAPVNDAPTLGGGAGSASYTEDDTTGVVVHAAITVADVDDTNLAGATVAIGTGFAAAEDELVFVDQNGITGDYDDATGVLSLTGSATKAQYQAALRSIRYRNGNHDQPSTTTRVVTFTVSDGHAVDPTSGSLASNVTVTAVNDAPTITAGSSSASFTEDQASPVVVDATVTVADVDDVNLEGATITVSGNYVAGEDVLGFTDQNGITGTVSGATLTLTGTATKADYQAALRSVTYENANHANPSTLTRTIDFSVTDGGLNSNVASSTLTVVAVNDAPVVTTGAGSAGFVEATSADPGTGAVAVDPGVTVTDGDDANIESAVVTIEAASFSASEDTLQFTSTPEILGAYSNGTLTLTGTATKAQYQAALRSVKYANSSDTPLASDRVVDFTVNDGDVDSNVATRTVTVTPADDPPTVALSTSTPSFTEAGSPVTVDDGLTVADVDSSNLASATVCVCSNRVNAEDELVYTPTNGITATAYNPATGTITLTGSLPGGFDTKANFQAALRTVQYRNTNLTTPSPTARGVRITVNDGSHDSTPVTKSVTVISLNDPPVLGGGGNTVAYTEDDPATVINNALTVSDADDTEIDGATVAITGNFDSSEDELSFVDIPPLTGSYNAATGVLTISGTATKAAYQAALRTVKYVNNDHVAPSSAPRTVSFVANDGEEDSDPVTTTITIAQKPDAPTLTAGTGNVSTFTEGGSSVLVDDGITVADVDSANLSGATVTITTGFSAGQGDTLAYTGVGSISGTYNGSTGILTLSGAGTKAEYQTVLRSVRFSNTSENPTTSRTVSFEVTDEASTASTAVTHAVTILPVNDAPVLAAGGSLAYTENQAATAVSPALTLTDVDSTVIAGASVAIGTGFAVSEDRLSFVSTANITGLYNAATGVLTLTGSDTVANYQAALRAVRYDNTSENPSTAQRTLTYTARDNGTPQLPATTTATIAVTAVNDAPVAANKSYSGSDAAIGNTSFVGNDSADGAPTTTGPRKAISAQIMSGTTDPDSSTFTVVPGTFASNDGGTVVLEADGDFTFTPAAGTSCTDHSDFFDYTVSDGYPGTPGTDTGRVTIAITDCVWYVDNQAAAGGNGRSTAPYNTLAAADTAAANTGDYIYVYKGDGTTTGLTDTAIDLLDTQRLVGAGEDLTVAGTTLEPGNDSNRPLITGSVNVENANTIEGLAIIASGGPAINGTNAGGADTGGTLDDLVLSGGTSGGISLVNTAGTWALSNLAVTTGTGTGILATSAGTVNFASAGTIAVTAAGPGVTLSGTAVSGVIDSTTVTASATTGVSLTSTTGSLILDDLNLTTTGTGLVLNNANGVTVRTQGGADGIVSSTSTAVDLSSDAGTPSTQPIVGLTQVTSSGGANGIRINGIGTGTFSASSGTLSGHSTAELSVTGGSGDVTYGGAIGNGSGLSAQVNNRTGGTVTASGNITDSNDAGGGISLSGNTSGTTTFSGTTKTLNTGASAAVSAAFSGSHTLQLTGGGLDIDTTTGAGFTATGSSGLVTVQGSGNTINTTTGTALNVDGPDFTSGNATFQAISSNGAANGINLVNTGSSGGLKVTGTGSSGSGGTITASTGPGIDLSSTAGVALSGINVTNGQDDGIRGASVNGFSIAGVAGGLSSSITGNGNAVDECGLDFTELSGTVTITNATVTGNADDNVAVVNDAATLSSFTVDGGTYGLNSATNGNDGIRLENNGSGATTATIKNVVFNRNRGDHVQVATDASNTATQNVTIQNNTMTADGNQPGFISLGGGITVNPAGNANTTVVIDNNSIKRARDSAIVINSPLASTATLRATITNNDIGTTGEFNSGSATGDGIYVNGHGTSTITTLIKDNDIRRYNNAFGIDILQNDGDGSINATVKGNTIAEPNPDPIEGSLSGMRISIGGDAADGGTSCLDIGDSSNAALKNQLFGTGVAGQPDVRFRMAGGASGAVATANLAGYTGGLHDKPAVNAYLAARNNVGGTPVVSSTQFDNFSVYGQVASCPTP